MKFIGLALLVGVIGYVFGVMLGIVAIDALSGNQHDKSLEAGMTGFFFTGPVLAIVSIIVFFVVRSVRK